MIKKLLKNRYFQLGVIVVFLFSALGFRLAYLTVELGETYYHMAQERKKIELTLRGARGNILDRNGIPLAVNRQIYVAQIDRQWMPNRDEDINRLLEQVIMLIEDNGERLEYNLPIHYGTQVYDHAMTPYVVDGFYYDFNTQLASRHQELYNRWRKDAGIRPNLPADEMLAHLRERYKIAEETADEMAAKIISIRLDLFMHRYRQYEPVRLAEDISSTTVTLLSTYTDVLPGVQVVVEAGRYYPNGRSAQHIIGYVGRITDKNIQDYTNRYEISPTQDGYNIFQDKYGQDGVEAYAERWLTGNIKERHGELEAEVDASRRVIQLLREKTPQNGHDVVLTLDSRLQRAAENVLDEELRKMRLGEFPYEGEKRQAPLAESGAIVIMDAHTGELLAMASYSDSEHPYDLNDFARGITNQEYAKLLNDPSNPLFGVAFQGQLEPGSIFKMLVGMGALMENKVTLQETIFDRLKHKHGPACWSPTSHGSINILDALKVSCNYFFTIIGERLGIDSIHQWGINLGLQGHPGLEILPFDPDNPLRNSNIVAHPSLREYINSDLNKAKRVREIMRVPYDLVLSVEESLELVRIERSDGTLSGGLWEVEQLTKLLLRMGYFDNKTVLNAAITDIRDLIKDTTTWTETYTLQASIGQHDTKTSPLGIARYIATLVNGGKVLDTHVVREIRSAQGDLIEETQPVFEEIELNEPYVRGIKEGMRRVVYTVGGPGGSGTSIGAFQGMNPEITLGGKTGTAQTGSFSDRNTAWFTAFSPFEDPEIVMVVMVPRGKSSANASHITRRMLEEYYRIQAQDQQNPLPQSNELLR